MTKPPGLFSEGMKMAENSNMPILWQNCLIQFRTEIARKAWVWFAETRGAGMLYDADRYAGEIDALVLALRPMLAASAAIHGADDEIMVT